jgi:adenylyltransferase/sulfurtransferase
MSDEFTRYHCQMALPGFGQRGQQLLQKARVLLIGAGGLGCPAAQYLAASGVGTIGLVDDDIVSESNLHRQILFTPKDVGLPKVEVASKRLQIQNPGVTIIPFHLRVTSSTIMELLKGFDLLIEGTDNFDTKYLLNDACVLSGKPLIYGAIYQYEGQVAIWNVLQKDGSYSPNYRDVFPDAETALVPDCSDGGVIPTLAGVVGCMQANEAIKYLTKVPTLLSGKLWMINIQEGNTRVVTLPKRTNVKITHLTETIPVVAFGDLQQMNGCQLIDVRTNHEHNTFNIGGINIPLDELTNQLPEIPASQPLVCYCASGKRSMVAARLIKNRYPKVEIYSLSGGIAGICRQKDLSR